MDKNLNITEVWRQTRAPVVVWLKDKGSRPKVRLPYAEDNRLWLASIGKSQPRYIRTKQYWEIPANWFNSFVEQALNRFNQLYIIQRHNALEVCAPACKNAKGHECQCSCLGAHHGQGNDGSWFEVSETLATRWRGREIAARLLVKK